MLERFAFLSQRLLGQTLAALLAAIVLTVIWQVLCRYLFNSPSTVSEEIARFLLIWIGLLGATYAYMTNAHIGMDFLVNKLRPTQQYHAKLLGHLCGLFFASCVLLLGGLNLVDLTLNPVQRSAALGIKMAYIYAVLPISGLLMSIAALAHIHRCIDSRRH
ncbi:TRAP transporter small permease [Bowmanella sp. Y26]|uniref:TRAP transporter small permease n=1 Tax=Bowmanella yangjiangensis TaxID=2811230 RepID=UPI001BDCBC28|nr:TRAP transporter small permease [Bowmanella yangjiangensis]MBT1063363.1 TRAP transporter small permease [Bowmanella yangjiangensis]